MTNIINSVIDWLASLANVALAILPESPIQSALDDNFCVESGCTIGSGPFSNIMGWINYFVPLQTMLNIMSAYVTCVLIYYGVRLILRWAKYIE
jgi:hypothetical protein